MVCMAASPRGRPRMQETADDIVASVLATAGPRVGTPAYSTRSLAELTGLSQSLTSRAVGRIRYPATLEESGGPGAPAADAESLRSDNPLHLVEFRVEFPRISIRFAPVRSRATVRPRLFERRASAVMAALWVSGAAAWSAERTSGPALEPLSETDYVATWVPGEVPWERFLARVSQLLTECERSPAAVPSTLLHQLAVRAGHGLHGVRWVRGNESASEIAPASDSNRVTVAEFPSPGRSERSRWLPRVELSATEQIAVALRKEMTDSGFAPGDRISVSAMSERLGLDPATIRTGMRQLADDGLLVSSERGFRIPQLSGADVIDLYASRLHVGMVILRACAGQPKHRLLPARLALGALDAVAKQGSRTDAGEADLRFQQELAEASGLTQSARSFHALTLRVRMFISILQLDYSPAAERLVSDDRRILAAVMEGRAQEAVRIWRLKQDNAVRHMSALAPDTFDAALWESLSR
ncbi:GntR family transcriptional regulator [Nesterenkonia natronophila]|uniref:GntR family transcriptional regulator n=2 Tax=Nesterenkonia natronophila TaxID=2174932 RepID=A0A3A4FD86_9MICC|nr:GntR family transcriptional regulator [Nesterenkonia natronophila]